MMNERLESRYLYAGTNLPSFGNNGNSAVAFVMQSSESIGQTQIVVDSQHNTYVMATTSYTLQVRKLKPDGAVDTNWISAKRNLLAFPLMVTNGTPQIAVDSRNRLIVQVNKKIYRFSSTGVLDESFGTRGVGDFSHFNNIIQFDHDLLNRLYVTGSFNGTGILVMRFNSRGRFDKTFDADGRMLLPLPSLTGIGTTGVSAQGTAIRVLADQKVVVMGDVFVSENKYGAIAYRLSAGGTIDQSYGDHGVAVQYETTLGNMISYRAACILGDGSVSIKQIDEINQTFTNAIFTNLGIFSNLEIDHITQKSFLEPDGGELSMVDNSLIRYKPDGSRQTSFLNGGIYQPVDDIHLDSGLYIYIAVISKRVFNRVSVSRFIPGIDPANV